MKLHLLFSLATATWLAAQQSAAPDLSARRQSVEALTKHLEMRQKRLDEVVAEIRARGQKTDQKIQEVVTMLAAVKDSQDSKQRISQVKGEAIAGLKRMIVVYKEERAKTLERLRTDDSAAAAALVKDMAVIDQLVEKRASDILQLVKSIPGGQDIAKFESAGGSYYDGFYEEETRVSEAWRQNRRDRVQSEKQRREIQQALEKAIAGLESRKSSITAALAAGGLTGADQELQQQELASVSSLITQRRSQLQEVSLPTTPPEQTASGDEADDIKQLFDDARRDIASEFAATLRLYHSAVDERDKIHAITKNLEARKKWLMEHASAAEEKTN